MKKEILTEDKAKKNNSGGVLVGERDGQTIIHDKGTEGGYLVGKLHKEGGIKGINKATGQPIEVQGGEVIITAPAVADQTKREFEGEMLTNREILSRINEKGGGVAFAEGGEMPKEVYYNGTSYNFGGKTMSDYEIMQEINNCGCDHEFENGGKLVSYDQKVKNLKIENKTTYPKVPTTKFFTNEVEVLPYQIVSKADRYIEEPQNLPFEYVDIQSIIPTQKNVTVQNLKSTKDVSVLPILFLYNQKYYVLDGHHRIANAILKNEDGVTAYVYDYEKNKDSENFQKGGEVEDLISKGIVELKMFSTKPEHAKEYGLDSKKPLYIQTLCVSETERLKGIGNKVLKYIDDYAIKNEHDVVFGHINQKAQFTKDERRTFFCDVDMIKNFMMSNGYAVNDDNNDFHKVIESNIRFEKGGLIAPNGKPSNLTTEQYKLVRTPEFKAWFGDWENDPENASKVVDENGEPLVVYHGTSKEFSVFGEGKNSQVLPKYQDKYLFRKNTNYFHKDINYAKVFGSKYGGTEKPYFLNIRRIELVDEDTIEDIGYWKNIYDYYFIIKGLDGVYSNSGQYATLLNPHQIKLANGSNTTFDADNPDIRFDDGGMVNTDAFLNYYFDELKDFLKNQNNITLNDDYSFSYKGETFTVEPIILSDVNSAQSIKEALFIIIDLDDEEIGTIKFNPNSNKKFIANSDFFEWNDIRFQSGGSVGDGVSLAYSLNVNTPINVEYLDNEVENYESGGGVSKKFWGDRAGGVLFYCTSTNRFLLLHRSKYVYEPNTWGIVSGKIDDDDTSIEDAVKREVKEETGQEVLNLFPSYVFKNHNFAFHNFISFVDEEFVPVLNWENQNYKWVKLEDFPKNLHFGVKLLAENEDLKNIHFKMKNNQNQKLIDDALAVFKEGGTLSVIDPNYAKHYYDNYNVDIYTFIKKLNIIEKKLGKDYVKNDLKKIVEDLAEFYLKPSDSKFNYFVNAFIHDYNLNTYDDYRDYINSLSDDEIRELSFNAMGLSTDGLTQLSTTKPNNHTDSNSNKNINTGNMIADISRLGIDVYDMEKASNDQRQDMNDLLVLSKLLPSFNQSKFAIERATIIKEMNRLKRKIDNEKFFKQSEMEKGTLFTPHGLLDYYYTQAIQLPTKKLDIPCELPTPNGEKSKLPLIAYLNVRTPQFKNWFGDWEKAYETNNYVNCSVLIDEETKEPKIFYHGVRKYVPAFGNFSNMGQGVVRPYGSFEPPSTFPASYFAENEEYAKFYGGIAPNMPTPSPDYQPFIYKVFIKMKNPLDITPLGFSASYKDLIDYLAVAYGVIAKMNTSVLNLLRTDGTDVKPVWAFIRNDIGLLETIKDYGFDGLIQIGDVPVFLPNGEVETDRSKYIQEKEFLTFAPSQIKSATVKKSFYFEFFNDIRFKQGGYVRI